MKNFKIEAVQVKSMRISCTKCNATGDKIKFVAIETNMSDKTPKTLGLVCATCLNIESVDYKEYLKEVGLLGI